MDTCSTSVAHYPPAQFSLRSLMLALTVACVVLAPAYWLGPIYLWPAVISLAMMGGCVWAFQRRRTKSVFFYAGLGTAIGAMFAMMPLFLHGAAAVVGCAVCFLIKARPRTVAVVLLLTGALCYGWVLAPNFSLIHRVHAMRAQYPFRSVAARLEFDATAAERESEIAYRSEDGFDAAVLERLGQMEQRGTNGEFGEYARVSTLERLHNETYHAFIIADGFGSSRMPPPQPENAILRPRQVVKLPLPIEGTTRPVAADTLDDVHQLTQRDFLGRERIGYVRSRNEVAGFDSHGFSLLGQMLSRLDGYSGRVNSDPTKRDDGSLTKWQVNRLELVSLLRHDEPRVYIAETLPQMDQLAEVSHRALDDFEKSALPKIQFQQDLVTDVGADRIKMLGAVRAGADCLQCHEGSRGKLLGAFSYELIAVEPSDHAR